jgi:CBS domain-containing protein
MLAKDIMVKEVVTLHPDDTLAEASMKFAEHKVSGCPVIDEDRVIVGMITESDILGHLKTQYKSFKMKLPPEIMFGISFEAETKEKEIVKAFDEIGSTKVRELMRRDVIAATMNDTIESVVRKMVKNKINRVPVTQDGRLVGIVTRGDVIGGLYQNENSTPRRSS